MSEEQDGEGVDYGALFSESFKRLTGGVDGHAFYMRFYEHFVERSEEIRKFFAESDMIAQATMIEFSLPFLTRFAQTHVCSKALAEIAKGHAELGIPTQLYTDWVEALLQTVQERDPEHNEAVELAWRITLAPGVEFMRGSAREQTGA